MISIKLPSPVLHPEATWIEGTMLSWSWLVVFLCLPEAFTQTLARHVLTMLPSSRGNFWSCSSQLVYLHAGYAFKSFKWCHMIFPFDLATFGAFWKSSWSSWFPRARDRLEATLMARTRIFGVSRVGSAVIFCFLHGGILDQRHWAIFFWKLVLRRTRRKRWEKVLTYLMDRLFFQARGADGWTGVACERCT
jgi:hypothetical protein